MVLFGRNDFKDIEEQPDSRKRKISEFIVHPEWDSTSRFWYGDIAIGVLKRMIEPTNYVCQICLNSQPISVFYGEQGTISGWGSTRVDGLGASTIALKLSVTIKDDHQCQIETPDLINLARTKNLKSRVFCAGNIAKGAACNGKNGRICADDLILSYLLQETLAELCLFQTLRMI